MLPAKLRPVNFPDHLPKTRCSNELRDRLNNFSKRFDRKPANIIRHAVTVYLNSMEDMNGD